jgi:polynucleotide 5'-hydroxyl-kinase GRC3/NOL9
MGATDRGKSTFCRYLARELLGDGTVGYLDCDTGQSSIGPPTTVGLALYRESPEDPYAVYLRFVGSTSPVGHTLQHLVATARLKEKAAAEGTDYLIIDSPGWVIEPGAQEFHIRMIDLLQPDLLVAIQSGHELEGIIINFRRHPRMEIKTVPVSERVVERRRGWRRIYRTKKFESYFSDLSSHTLSLAGIGVHGRMPGTFRDEDWHGLAIALCDPEMMVITLGIVENLDIIGGTITFRSPPFDPRSVASLHVGSIRIDLPEDREEPSGSPSL